MFGQHHFSLQKISQSVSWLFKVLITLMSLFFLFLAVFNLMTSDSHNIYINLYS